MEAMGNMRKSNFPGFREKFRVAKLPQGPSVKTKGVILGEHEHRTL